MRPDPMSPTHRRPRQIDTSRHFCPREAVTTGAGWGWGISVPTGIRTAVHGVNSTVPPATATFQSIMAPSFMANGWRWSSIVRVLACLAEGLGIRATARGFEVDPNTVLQWLVEAAEQLQAFSAYFLCNVHVNQLQLDELYAVLREVKDGVLSEHEAIERLERSPALGMDRHGPREQAAAGDGRRPAYPGDGPTGGASCH